MRMVLNKPVDKIIYHMSGLFPRNHKLWVFGGQNGSFSCNTKYLFIEASLRYAEQLDCIWISKNKETIRNVRAMGFRAQTPYSLKGFYYCLRAGFYFINNHTKEIGFNLSKGSCYINLWHGIPLKKIQADNKKRISKEKDSVNSGLIERFFRPKKFFKYNYILSPSRYVTKYSFETAFNLDEGRFLEYGYPRTDVLFYSNEEIDSFLINYEPLLFNFVCFLNSKAKVFMYAPTWRDTEDDLLTISGIDFKDLNCRLKAINGCFLLKLHPYTKLNLSSLEGLDCICVVDSDKDIYPLMKYIDVLITDYSSIYFDFILQDKKVVFFAFDFDSYLKGCRDLYFDYNEVTPGAKVYNYSELVHALFNDNNDEFKLERERVRKKFWGDYSGGAASALIERLLYL